MLWANIAPVAWKKKKTSLTRTAFDKRKNKNNPKVEWSESERVNFDTKKSHVTKDTRYSKRKKRKQNEINEEKKRRIEQKNRTEEKLETAPIKK